MILFIFYLVNEKTDDSSRHKYSVVVWESESSGNMEWHLEDSFGIEDVLNDSEPTQHACTRWFSCENGLFVLVVGIGSLIHLYSLVETNKECGLNEGSLNHRYKKITTVETRSYATPSELGMLLVID